MIHWKLRRVMRARRLEALKRVRQMGPECMRADRACIQRGRVRESILVRASHASAMPGRRRSDDATVSSMSGCQPKGWPSVEQ